MMPAAGASSFPPPPPAALQTLGMADAADDRQHRSTASTSGDGISPSLLVIAAIIAFVFVVSASIHLLLRFLGRRATSSPSSSSSSGASSPLAPLNRSASSSEPRGGEGGEKDLIDSLPMFTLASALAVLPKSSADCAVCLSSFHPDDQLRLLPSCCHAFHAACIDTWLRSSLSCPLCRSPIVPDAPPAPPPALAPPSSAASHPPPLPDRSGSFRVEIGSVSRRIRAPPDAGDGSDLPSQGRSYSLGSSFRYVVEEEVEAVVAAQARQQQHRRKDEDDKDAAPRGGDHADPAPPGESVAEAAGWGGGGSSRSWLRDYVDRLASSASSSFSSLRFGGCGSRRIDGGVVVVPGAVGGGWDLEGALARPAAEDAGGGDDDDDSTGAYYSFYRWLIGA